MLYRWCISFEAITKNKDWGYVKLVTVDQQINLQVSNNLSSLFYGILCVASPTDTWQDLLIIPKFLLNESHIIFSLFYSIWVPVNLKLSNKPFRTRSAFWQTGYKSSQFAKVKLNKIGFKNGFYSYIKTDEI